MLVSAQAVSVAFDLQSQSVLAAVLGDSPQFDQPINLRHGRMAAHCEGLMEAPPCH